MRLVSRYFGFICLRTSVYTTYKLGPEALSALRTDTDRHCKPISQGNSPPPSLYTHTCFCAYCALEVCSANKVHCPFQSRVEKLACRGCGCRDPMPSLLPCRMNGRSSTRAPFLTYTVGLPLQVSRRRFQVFIVQKTAQHH